MNFSETHEQRLERVRKMTTQQLLDSLLLPMGYTHVRMKGQCAPYIRNAVEVGFREGEGDSFLWELLWDAMQDLQVLAWDNLVKRKIRKSHDKHNQQNKE